MILAFRNTLLALCMVFTVGSQAAAGSAQNRLPDGETAVLRVNGTTYAAWYGTPTLRYRHAILGDAVEAASLHLETGGAVQDLLLPEDQVFEDRTPRLVDLDGDGRPEIVTIRSYQDAGGSVAIYGIRDGSLVELATSRPIGRANRWLNIAGIADYLGTGQNQIAFVETPHIGGTLHIAEWRGKKLTISASLAGFSNHRIGARDQDLSATVFPGLSLSPHLIVPSNDRRVLRIVAMADGSLMEAGRQPLGSPVARHIAGGRSNKACALFELEDGSRVDVCSK